MHSIHDNVHSFQCITDVLFVKPAHAQVVLSSAVTYVGVTGVLPSVQDLQGGPGGCESVPEMYDDSSVITYVCQAQSPSRYNAHQQAHSNLKHCRQTTKY